MKKTLAGLSILALTATASACGGSVGETEESAVAEVEVADGVLPSEQLFEGEQPDPVTLTLVTAFAETIPEHAGVTVFQEQVAQRAPWITIQYVGASEVVPSTESVKAVADGTYDLVDSTATVYSQFMPAADLSHLRSKTPEEERADGSAEIIDGLYEDRGLHHVGTTTPSGTHQYRLFLGDAGAEFDVADPDLQGAVVRGGTQYSGVIEGLGGSRVEMSQEETYLAMERGVVDGFGAGESGIYGFGLGDVTDYEVAPSFNYVTFDLMMNLDRWKGLDPKTQEALTTIMEDVEGAMVDAWTRYVEADEGRRADDGIEVLAIDEAAQPDYLRSAACPIWESLLEEDAELKQLHDLWGYDCGA